MTTAFVVAVAVPAGLGWDFANFYDAGRRAAAGQIGDLYDPDSPIGGELPQGGLSYWSPPISAWFYAPLAGLEPRTALAVFKVQNVLAYVAAFFVLYSMNRRYAGESALEQWRFAALFVWLCLFFQPFWSVFRVGGQTTPTVLLLMVLALGAHRKECFVGSALLVVLAILVKPALVTGLAFLVLVSPWRFRILTAAWLGVAGLVSLAIAPWDLHMEFVHKMLGGAGRTFPWIWNSSLYVLVEASGLGQWASLGGKLAVVATFVVVVVKSRAAVLTAASRRHLEFVLAILFFLLISQTVWEHYLALLFVFLLDVTARARSFPAPAIRVVAAVFLCSLGQNIALMKPLGEMAESLPPAVTGLIVLGKCAPLLLTWWFLGRGWYSGYLNENGGARDGSTRVPDLHQL